MAISMPARRPAGSPPNSAAPSRDQRQSWRDSGVSTSAFRRLYRVLAWTTAIACRAPRLLASHVVGQVFSSEKTIDGQGQPASPETRRGGSPAGDPSIAWGTKSSSVTASVGAAASGGGRDEHVASSTSERGRLPSSARGRGFLHWLVIGVMWQNIIQPLWDVVSDVAQFYWSGEGADLYSPRFVRVKAAKRAMRASRSYEEWKQHAQRVDSLNNAQRWKMRFESDNYDYDLVRDHLDDLYQARRRDDRRAMAFLLRSSLQRNLGGLRNPKLFREAMLGTKDLVEQYINEVVYQLEYLSTVPVPGMTDAEKVDLFLQLRMRYGRSALLLSGGGGLGIHHLGVLRALYEHELLPRIISGSSAGALVSSLLCTKTEPELGQMLRGEIPVMRSTFLMVAEGEEGDLWSRVEHFLKFGVLGDVETLKKACQANFGDITFQEAYDQTHRILNITVNSPNQLEAPRLLNYITSPNVVIWTAACASCALSYLFDPVEILCKDKEGRFRLWNPPGQQWSDGSLQSDLPMQRLSEIFNVNHFIVSQVNPHVVPALKAKKLLSSRLVEWVTTEIAYRAGQLVSMGVMPKRLQKFLNVIDQNYIGDITIVPDFGLEDYFRVISNPTAQSVEKAMLAGEQATWPKLSEMEIHCKVELALDTIVQRLRGTERWTYQ